MEKELLEEPISLVSPEKGQALSPITQPVALPEEIDKVTYHYGLGELLGEKSSAVITLTQGEVEEILTAPTRREKFIRWLFKLLVKPNEEFSLVITPKKTHSNKQLQKHIHMSATDLEDIKEEMIDEIRNEILDELRNNPSNSINATPRKPIEWGQYDQLVPPIRIHWIDKQRPSVIIIDANNRTRDITLSDARALMHLSIWEVVIP